MQAKGKSLHAAEAAQAAVVAPLQLEVTRLTEQLEGLQSLYASELAGIEASARQQAASAAAVRAEAQAAVDSLAGSSSLQQKPRGEADRAAGLGLDIAQLQVGS